MAVEELVKLKSVFDVIGHWVVDLLKKQVRLLNQMISNEENKNDLKQLILEHSRFLTVLLGMLASQTHLGKYNLLQGWVSAFNVFNSHVYSLLVNN